MRKTVWWVLPVVALSLVAAPCWAADRQIELLVPAKVKDVQLDPGKYRVRLGGEGELIILKGRTELVKVKVEKQPLGNEYPNSVVVSKDGILTEIRLSNEKLILMETES